MSHEDFEPFGEAARDFHKVIEVYQSGIFEDFNQVGHIIRTGKWSDGDERAFDAELFVGEVENSIDGLTREPGALESVAPDGERRT